MSRMIIIAGTIDLADDAARAEALRVGGPLQQKTRVEEPGCLAYVFAADPCVAGRLGVYELWQDEASLAAHFKHPNYEKMVELLAQTNIVESINQAYLVERGEPVYGPNGEKKTTFFAS